jgi:hypothetical protein
MTHEQDWHDLLPRIRARWPQLTEAELEPTRGERGALVTLVHGIIGGDERALSREIDLLLADDPSAEAHGPGSMPLRANASDAEMADQYAKGHQASERVDEGPALADASGDGTESERDTEDDAPQRRAGGLRR